MDADAIVKKFRGFKIYIFQGGSLSKRFTIDLGKLIRKIKFRDIFHRLTSS